MLDVLSFPADSACNLDWNSRALSAFSPPACSPNDDNVHVTSACEWPEYPWPSDDNVHVTSACEWPEHPWPNDDNVHVARIFFL